MFFYGYSGLLEKCALLAADCLDSRGFASGPRPYPADSALGPPSPGLPVPTLPTNIGYATDTPSTTATFVAVVDPGTRISFLFARCRYLPAAAVATDDAAALGNSRIKN